MRDIDRPPPDLERAIAELRQEPDISPAWVEAVAARAAVQRFDDVAAPKRTRWSISPSVAIAAGLFCAAVGSALTLGVGVWTTSRRVPQTPLVAASASAPTVRFILVAPGAAKVALVGDFNAWNPVALPMRRLGDGTTWEIEVPLTPGRYTYAFLVDGRLAKDPAAPEAAHDDFGGPSSVVFVRGT